MDLLSKDFCTRLAELLSAPGKFDNPAELLKSAVLVPLVRQGDELSVLFEVRSNRLAWQPGEICFPGGRIEECDAVPAEAALRETAEELGLEREHIRFIGNLDYIISPIGVMIYPYVGYIGDSAKIAPNPEEVEEVFAVPLAWLLAQTPQTARMEVATRPLEDFPFELVDGGNYPRTWKKRTTYSVLFYRYREYVIWGLTAHILSGFLQKCRGAGAG